MSDRLVFFRMMVGEIARKHGLFASWMPKPFADRTGSGAHYNMSLADASGTNLFAAEDDPRGCGLSTLGYQFIAGVLRHAHAICAVIAPTVNSYKRLVKQGSMSGLTWAPVFACYGDNNRTNMLRIPKGGGRVECRLASRGSRPGHESSRVRSDQSCVPCLRSKPEDRRRARPLDPVDQAEPTSP